MMREKERLVVPGLFSPYVAPNVDIIRSMSLSSLSLILASISSSLSHPLAPQKQGHQHQPLRIHHLLSPPQQVGMTQPESQESGQFPSKITGMISLHCQRYCCLPLPEQAQNYNKKRFKKRFALKKLIEMGKLSAKASNK